jgi:hypothetical protein
MPRVVGPMACEREYRGEEAIEYMTERNAKTETAKFGMKTESSRKSGGGHANQSRAVRLYPPVSKATITMARTPVPKRS